MITGLAQLNAKSATKKLDFSVLDTASYVDCAENFIYDQSAFCRAPMPAHNLVQPSDTPTVRRRLETDKFSTVITPNATDLIATAQAASAELARNVLRHKVQLQLNEIFNYARGSGETTSAASFVVASSTKSTASANISINLQDFDDYLSTLEAATIAGGWDALSAQTPTPPAVTAVASHYQSEAEYAASEEKRRAQYIAAYVKAYFRQGHFLQLTVDVNAVQAKLASAIKDALPKMTGAAGEDPYSELAKQMINLTGLAPKTFGTIDSIGYVSRGGEKLQFPSVQAAVNIGQGRPTITKIDYTAAGSDLIRVLLYAIYDAHDGVPAVSNATGATDKIIDTAWQLGVNESTKVGSDEFAEIETTATELDGITAAGFGRLIRGIGIISLNNEALATALETALGAAVRKYSEKVLWCWYACQPSPGGGTKTSSASTALTAGPRKLTLTVSITGGPQPQVATATRK